MGIFVLFDRNPAPGIAGDGVRVLGAGTGDGVRVLGMEQGMVPGFWRLEQDSGRICDPLRDPRWSCLFPKD